MEKLDEFDTRVINALNNLNNSKGGKAVGVKIIHWRLLAMQDDGEEPIQLISLRESLARLVNGDLCDEVRPGYFLTKPGVIHEVHEEDSLVTASAKKRETKKRKTKRKTKRKGGRRRRTVSITVRPLRKKKTTKRGRPRRQSMNVRVRFAPKPDVDKASQEGIEGEISDNDAIDINPSSVQQAPYKLETKRFRKSSASGRLPSTSEPNGLKKKTAGKKKKRTTKGSKKRKRNVGKKRKNKSETETPRSE